MPDKPKASPKPRPRKPPAAAVPASEAPCGSMPDTVRAYRLGQRQAAMDEKRRQILLAARALILSEQALAGFSVDGVAKQAGVARATVYNQFGNRTGLLEALFDELAAQGGMPSLAQVFQQADPVAALDAFIRVFGGFWASERLLIRRLHALAVLDPGLRTADGDRNQRRRMGLRRLVGQLRGTAADEALVSQLYALTSFAFFDQLAGQEQSPLDVVPWVQQAARRLLGMS